MSPNLHIVILVFAGTMLVNVFTSVALWYIHRSRIFGYITLSWVITSINFFLQNVFTSFDYKMLLAYSFYVLASWVYYEITSLLMLKADRRWWVYVIPVILISLGLVVLAGTGSYRFASLFCAIAIAMPLLCAALKTRHGKESRGDSKGFQVLGVLLVLLAVHYLDYPFLRQSESGSIFGYTFAFLLTFSFSIFFPSFLLWQLAAEYNRRLQDEVTKRTKELVDLDSRNKALISILVHDLATPVTTSLLALGKIGDGTHKSSMEKLDKSLRYIMTTIDKVRELQAVAAGKKTLELKVSDPMESVQNAIQYYAEPLASQNLSVRYIDNRIRAESSVLIDPQLLQGQIIGNLISNAIKFSPRGEEIVIRVSEDERFLNIEVIDFGIGIPANLAPKIFQFTGVTTRNGVHNEKGTGFGLPLVKAYVDMMHGRIDFKTNYKDSNFARPVGVNMRVRFPLVVKPQVLSKEPESPQTKPL